MLDVKGRLHELGLTLPEAPKPVAAYVPVVRTGDLLFISGQLPMAHGTLTAKGIVPRDISLEDAQLAARQCALNALAILHDAVEGDWSRLVRIVKLGVFVACDAAYTEQAKVANGASEFLAQVLGEAGRHARAAVGVASLPLGAPVEVDLIAQVRA